MSEHHIFSATMIVSLLAFVGFGTHATFRPRDYSFIANRGKWEQVQIRLVLLTFTCGSVFML